LNDDGYSELIESGNLAIADMAMKCEAVFSNHRHAHVGISGGADSDVMLDLCERVRKVQPIRITYNFQDTGIEYRATRDHLDYLEERYGVKINRTRAIKSIPVCCHEHGLPFLSKMVSEQIGKLQKHGFKWEDLPLEELKKMYPDAPESALKWWTNEYTTKSGAISSYCIDRNRALKGFILENPPQFKVSSDCCYYAKKKTAKHALKKCKADLDVTGMRRSEGGTRSLSGKCYIEASHYRADRYRPLYWLSNQDRLEYSEKFGIRHSDCYEVWGFTRTGCVGCPFNKDVFNDLDIARPFEPNIVKAAEKIFGESYEYTRQYKDYRAKFMVERQLQRDNDRASTEDQ